VAVTTLNADIEANRQPETGDARNGVRDVNSAMKHQHPELQLVRAALNETNSGAQADWIITRKSATAHFTAHLLS